MACASLRSLLGYSAAPLRLLCHDDGTMTATDREKLAESLEGVEILSRSEADERLAAYLAHRPATRRLRHQNPLLLKLVDVVALAPEDAVAGCDSDILFLRPFSDLFPPSYTGTATFMADRQNAYSIRSWQLPLQRRLKLACRVNTGIFWFPRRHYDPELVEWFLSRERYHRTPPWLEQTCWALLAQRAGCRLYDPRRVRLAHPQAKPDEEAVALHFVSPVRRSFWEQLETHAERLGEPPIRLTTIPSRRCGFLALAWNEMSRRLSRLGRW